jgi:SAM-dependent methyltransferase
MSWYQDWFNSENYLKVYSHRDESEAERLVKLILDNLNFEANSKVLDMACGSGRHAIIFSKKGFDVTAIDISERLVANARVNALQNNVKINFVLSDILEYNTNQKFKLALNLFTSIGYFESDEDNFRVIKKAYDLLIDGGYFVLDYFNKNFLLKNLVPTTVFSENGLRITQNRSIQGNRIRKDITIENRDTIEEFYESVRLFNHLEISNFFMEVGFTDYKEFGDYYGNNFDNDSSTRLIIFGKK